jgi:hypothetical protein
MVTLFTIRVAFGDRVVINRGDFLLRPMQRCSRHSGATVNPDPYFSL